MNDPAHIDPVVRLPDQPPSYPAPTSIDDLLSQEPEPPPDATNWMPGQSALPSLGGPAPSIEAVDLPAAVAVFDLDATNTALRLAQFGPSELLQRLIGLARDPDPAISLAALRELRRHFKDVAVLNGLIAQSTLKTKRKTKDGQHLEGSVQTRTLHLQGPGTPAPSASHRGTSFLPAQSPGTS